MPTGGTPTCGGLWTEYFSGQPIRAGLGLREPAVNNYYGVGMDNGALVLPQCAHFTGNVKIPVLMLDWLDFNPVTDPSDENNGLSTFPAYVPSTPAALSTYLNSSVSKYFGDVSGQQLNLSFEVFGWVQGDVGRYFKDRASYLYQSGGTWYCNRYQVVQDAVRQAIVDHGVDFRDYDADCNGTVDGMVIVYEGMAGLCNGTNASFFNVSADTNTTPPTAILAGWANTLVPGTDPNYGLFKDQDVALTYFANIAEQIYYPAGDFTYLTVWAHELGHVIWGYRDYYAPGFEVKEYALSGNLGSTGPHPAAMEKWLFGHWFEPVTLSASGSHSLAANEIADGAAYDVNSDYIYVIYPHGDPNRFLTVEARWFSDENNTASSWAESDNARESGIVIFEFDLTQSYYSSTKHLFRHAPAREAVNGPWKAFRPGDVFNKCFATQCVTITPQGSTGAVAGFDLSLVPTP